MGAGGSRALWLLSWKPCCCAENNVRRYADQKAHSFCYELLAVFQTHLIAHSLWELTKVKKGQCSKKIFKSAKMKKKDNENRNISLLIMVCCRSEV